MSDVAARRADGTVKWRRKELEVEWKWGVAEPRIRTAQRKARRESMAGRAAAKINERVDESESRAVDDGIGWCKGRRRGRSLPRVQCTAGKQRDQQPVRSSDPDLRRVRMIVVDMPLSDSRSRTLLSIARRPPRYASLRSQASCRLAISTVTE